MSDYLKRKLAEAEESMKAEKVHEIWLQITEIENEILRLAISMSDDAKTITSLSEKLKELKDG